MSPIPRNASGGDPGRHLRRPPSLLRLVLYLVAIGFVVWWLSLRG